MSRTSRRAPPPKDCLLLLNGEIPEPRAVRSLALRLGRLVCADGGARHAAALGLEPDFVVGDMDSLPHPLPPWRRTVYWCDFDQDRSDFEKALDFARDLGSGEVYVAGALGGRVDHALVNLALIERHAPRLVLVDRGLARCLEPGRYRLALRKGETFSILAARGGCQASLSGARYPLRCQRLKPGARGLGNRALGPVRLLLHAGSAWVIQPC